MDKFTALTDKPNDKCLLDLFSEGCLRLQWSCLLLCRALQTRCKFEAERCEPLGRRRRKARNGSAADSRFHRNSFHKFCDKTMTPNKSPEPTPKGAVSPHTRALLLGSARLSFFR